MIASVWTRYKLVFMNCFSTTHFLTFKRVFLQIPLSSANESLDEIVNSMVQTKNSSRGKHASRSEVSEDHFSSTEPASHRSPPTLGSQVSSTPIGSKLKRIIVFNKTDLADPRVTAKWRLYFDQSPLDSNLLEESPIWLSLTSDGKRSGGDWSEKQRKAFRQLLQSLHRHPMDESALRLNTVLESVGSEALEHGGDLRKRGKFGGGALPFKPHVSMIIGVPNVGKSTLINQLTGRRGAVVTPKPATTRSFQLFKIDPVDHSCRDTERHSQHTSNRSGRSGIKLTPRTIELPDDPTQLSLSSTVSKRSSGTSHQRNLRGSINGGGSEGGDANGRSRGSTQDKTLWIMDTPGVMLPHRIDNDRGLKLALCGNIADKVIPGGYPTLAKYLHHLLLTLPYAPTPAQWISSMKLPLPLGISDAVGGDRTPHGTIVDASASSSHAPPSMAYDSSFNHSNFESLMDQIGRTYGKKDEYTSAEMFVHAFRHGKLGPFSLELPPSEEDEVLL